MLLKLRDDTAVENQLPALLFQDGGSSPSDGKITEKHVHRWAMEWEADIVRCIVDSTPVTDVLTDTNILKACFALSPLALRYNFHYDFQ